MEYDAIVIGAGPNGLAAAITLALENLSVLVLEEKDTVGGGCRSQELTLPGYIHDVCSSIYPLALGSPFLRTLPLDKHGLEWIHPAHPLAHPFDDGRAAILDRSIEVTCRSLEEDGTAYKKVFEPLVQSWNHLESTLLGPLTIPHHLIESIQFGLKAVKSAKWFAKGTFSSHMARGLFAGLAAHSILPLNKPLTAAIGIVLAITGHIYGWPMVKGGAQNLANALRAYFESLGGTVITGEEVVSVDQLPSSRAVLFDLTPRQILQITGDKLGACYKKQLERYRYGPGVFKVDWALSEPIPWRAKECSGAGTVHLGGTLEEIIQSEKMTWEGKHCDTPYVLLAQQSIFDSNRAPKGKHTAWAYCHVPHGSVENMEPYIEQQVERFAPGFKDGIIAKSTKNTQQMTDYNSNYIGGDIVGGVQDMWQLFTRPVMKLVPYATSHSKFFICSSSTPPGGGVHGMCGYHAAKVVLKRLFGK